MESVFRLCVLRTGSSEDDLSSQGPPRLSLAQNSAFQRSINAIEGTPDAVAKTIEQARLYAKGPSFLKDEKSVAHAAELAKFSQAVEDISNRWLALPKQAEGTGDQNAQPSLRDEIAGAAKEAFGDDNISPILSKLQPSVPLLKDTIIVIKRLPEEHFRPIARFTQQLLDINLLFQISQTERFPTDINVLESFRNQPLLLPTAFQLASIKNRLATVAADRLTRWIDFESQQKLKAQSLYDQYHAINNSVKELSILKRDVFQDPMPPPDVPAYQPPSELTADGLAQKRLDILQNLETINQRQFEASISLAAKGGTTDPARVMDTTGALAANNLAQVLLNEHKEITPRLSRPAWNPSQIIGTPQLLKPVALERLSQGTRELLKMHDIPLLERPLQESLDTLALKLRSVTSELRNMYKPSPDRISITRIGSKEIIVRQPMLPPWIQVAAGQTVAPPVTWWAGPVPIQTSLGKIQPAGEADLLIVKQRLRRYEGGDVAHVENILRGEVKSRENVVKTVTETYSFLEQESTSSKETGEESTDRFETAKEAENQLKQDDAVAASATVSGSYGPMVSFSASASYASSTSQQASLKTATKFAKDVTDRSTEKIAQRILERTSKTITTTISETNLHKIDNKALGKGNTAGVYQWVNKVYEARLHNYGTRKMYDFMVPEPAAFLIYQKTLPVSVNSLSLLKAPEKFDMNPDVLTPELYEEIMRSYGLDPTTADPYPPIQQLVQHTDKNMLPTDGTGYINLLNIKIPDGYEATLVKVTLASDGEFGSVAVQLGEHRIVVDSDAHGSIQMTSQDLGVSLRGEIPLFYNVYVTHGDSKGKALNWFVMITITCNATTALTDWQNRTWKKISLAVDTLQQAYETKLAEIRAREDSNNFISIKGTNPASNMATVREEIKRSCIGLITNNSYENLSAVNQTIPGQPQPGEEADDPADPKFFPTVDAIGAQIDGRTVAFFEQAFEWSNMTFSLYPYFWARKSTWLSRIAYDDPDPTFNSFLRAGYARVTLPVRPGYASAVAHYFDFGELWGGGPLPPVGSKDYVSVADEQMEQTGAPVEEKSPPSEPWPVLVPTTLMYLRPDDTLPRWKENSTGDWVELMLKDGKWVEQEEETT